jgi:glycosyl transferase family 22 (putative mannosyltransferase)
MDHPAPFRPEGDDAERVQTAFAFALAAVLLVSAVEAASLYRFYLAQSRLPLWDMAGHGWGGVELLRALEQGRPLRFLDLLNRQDKWPFGYSLLLLPFLAAGGASFASATLLSTVLFALTPLLLLWAAREVDSGPAGLWAGLLAAALFLASPVPRLFAVLVMRETAGVFFSLLAFCLYLRARRLGSLRSWRLAGLACLALVFVKYNYALTWGLAVLVHEAWRLPPDRRRELARRTARLLRPWRQDSPGKIVLAVYLDLLIAATLLGVNPGVGIYAGLVIGAVALIVRFLRDREGVRDRWRRLPTAVRAILATVVLPLWIWCLSPSPIHPKSIAAFLRNRAAGPPLPSADSLLFYFRSLARHYAPEPFLGLLVILFLIVALLGLRKSDEGFRLLALTALVGLGLAIAHPYKEIRFLAVAAPFLMLAAAMAFSRAAHGRDKEPLRRGVLAGLLCATAFAGIAWTAVERADLDARLARDYKLYSGRPGLWRVLELLADRTAGAPRVAVIGTFNELSDNLVRWWLALKEETRDVTVVRPPSRPSAERTAAQRVRQWLERERPARILAIRLLPSSRLYRSRDFQLYNAWQHAAIDILGKDPAWRVRRRKKFAGLELEVMVMDRAASTAPSPPPPPARSLSPPGP